MSSAPGGALVESAKDLFAVMSSPFEADPRSHTYEADFTLPVSPDRAIFTREEATTYFFSLIGRNLDPRRHWHVAVGALPDSDEIGFQSLALPLRVPNDDQWLFLRRTSDSVEPSHVHVNESSQTKMSLLMGRGAVATKLDHRLIDQALANADYGLPQLFTDPASLRLGLAELSDKALDWSTREETVTSHHPGASTNFRRQVEHFVGNDEEGERRSLYATKLSAIFEREVRQGLFQRWRIFFNGDDSLISLPRVALQRIQRPSAVPINAADSKTVILSSDPVEPSPALLDELAGGILDTMVELDLN
jgi:hypothetical protein